jgi:AcrR family transcriptional regulator
VDRVVDCAIGYIETHGHETLTMRKLATILGVSPMAVYRHIESKQELLSLIGDRFLAELTRPVHDDEGWQRYLEQWFGALHALMLRRPLLAHAMADQPLSGPVAWRAADEAIGVLIEEGLDPGRAGEIFTSLLTYTIGFSLLRLGRSKKLTDPEAIPAGIELGDLPHLFQALRHYQDWLSTTSFEHGVRTFLRGLGAT